ncbi:hypothetical protein D9758_010824 [Tetrapyrgos nigripes]|uniref:DUF6534 domain-containing protein n=1 Tax=Tetrapyrgos nigripes TaxID=182062 RepID=A0A8H5GI64_9AGAR|nr:hypothetical protein D9758_010824 [Tetrapyrgos nigripes]
MTLSPFRSLTFGTSPSLTGISARSPARARSCRPPSAASNSAMDATQINLHKVIGPMLIGAWLNLMLFVLVINQSHGLGIISDDLDSRSSRYHIDKILIKIAVFAVLVCDMGTIIAGCADAYLLASTLYLTTIVILFQSQGNLLPTQILPATILWLSTAMVADLLIALLMILYYRATDVDRTLKSSSKLIRRLAILALKTGSFTALIAVLTLVTFVTDIQSNVTMIFGYCIGSIYSLTLLYNLNIRRKLVNRTNPGDVLDIRVPDLESRTRVTKPVASNGGDILNVESRSQRGRFVIAASIHT